MMPGIPGGRQLAAGPSSGGLARAAALLAAYSAVRAGPDSRPAPEPPRPPRGPVSQTPVKSGSLPVAAQSAAAGVLRVKLCAIATESSAADTSEAAANPDRILSILFMRA